MNKIKTTSIDTTSPSAAALTAARKKEAAKKAKAENQKTEIQARYQKKLKELMDDVAQKYEAASLYPSPVERLKAIRQAERAALVYTPFTGE